MTIRLIDTGWYQEFENALSNADELCIVCPFVKADSIERLLAHRPGKIQVITRFNLDDFAEGVSDVAALRKLLDADARVRGIRNLHAKLYLFGHSRAIITSANLTQAALGRNHELGIVTDDSAIIEECRTYFDGLWERASDDLKHAQVDEWDRVVTDFHIRGGHPKDVGPLVDFGADVGVVGTPYHQVPIVVSEARQAFVKFLGTGNNRFPLADSTLEHIEGGGCHWAACYPAKKRPRGVRDGAVLFMGWLTRNPQRCSYLRKGY